jgi:pimeloyl-ACP methyl ester carboxylesterase
MGSGGSKYAPRARRLTRLIYPTTHVLSDGLLATTQMDAEFYFAYDERVKWRELAAVRCPVLVVRGADSHLWDDASVDKVLGALTPGCGAKAIIPNAGHWVVRASPPEFTTINVHSDTIKLSRGVRLTWNP